MKVVLDLIAGCFCVALTEKSGIALNKVKNNTVAGKRLDAIDQSFLLISVGIVAVCLTTGILLNKCREKWELNGMFV
jgi:hypothetical protein